MPGTQDAAASYQWLSPSLFARVRQPRWRGPSGGWGAGLGSSQSPPWARCPHLHQERAWGPSGDGPDLKVHPQSIAWDDHRPPFKARTQAGEQPESSVLTEFPGEAAG